ncbi:MAG: DNA-binding response regulator [Sphingobacteriales bacterium]|jgi:DNA-binding NarL/FixJ family response regulator|nr:MAG: DNA-binding response regulator [Sphingobacteriales bacterium]
MKNKLTIMVVDDHPIFLKGLVEILQDELKTATIFAYTSSVEALKNFTIINPDIAILDLDMPVINGIKLSENLKVIKLTLKVIILTMHKEPDIIRSVIAKGIDGFVFKDDAVNELTNAIKNVLANNIYLSDPSILNQTEDKNEILATLTKTECLVLKHIAQNKTSKQIADTLFVSIKTIENHRNNISKKLQLTGSNSLLTFAVKNSRFF